MFDIILGVLKMNSLLSKSSFIKNSAFKFDYILSSHENTTNVKVLGFIHLIDILYSVNCGLKKFKQLTFTMFMSGL